MKLVLYWLLIGTAFGGLASTPAEAECLDGCSSISLNVGDYVQLSASSTSNCTACGTGTVYAYTIMVTGVCGDCFQVTCPKGSFCSTSDVSAGNFVVQSIGSGCSSTPQGCVRLCRPCS